MTATVVKIYPSPDETRDAVGEAVFEAVLETMAKSRLARYSPDQLGAAMDGIVDALTHICLHWTNGAPGASEALAKELAGLLVDQVVLERKAADGK